MPSLSHRQPAACRLSSIVERLGADERESAKSGGSREETNGLDYEQLSYFVVWGVKGQFFVPPLVLLSVVAVLLIISGMMYIISVCSSAKSYTHTAQTCPYVHRHAPRPRSRL